MVSALLRILSLIALLAGGGSAPTLAATTTPSAPPPATPALLIVATRQIQHPSFRETVVLIARHGRGGPIGIIVNRPLDVPLDKVFPSLEGSANHRLHEGGPVAPGQISFVFRGGPLPADGFAVGKDTYIARSPTLLGELVRGTRPHNGLRVVAGFAGWARGQLEHEIARGDWLVLPMDSNAVFDMPPASMWNELHRRATQLTAQAGDSWPPAGADDGSGRRRDEVAPGAAGR